VHKLSRRAFPQGVYRRLQRAFPVRVAEERKQQQQKNDSFNSTILQEFEIYLAQSGRQSGRFGDPPWV
jgi:hypothetical protein